MHFNKSHYQMLSLILSLKTPTKRSVLLQGLELYLINQIW